MLGINEKQTFKNAKRRLSAISELILNEMISVKAISLLDVDDSFNFSDICEYQDAMLLRFQSELDRDFRTLSRLSERDKKIIYAVHFLRKKRKRLLASENVEAIETVGSPYRDYERALVNFGVSRLDLIAFD